MRHPLRPLLRCGLRVSEVAHLQLGQIDWDQQALRIEQGKGRKERYVYMSPDAVASVQHCLAQHPGARAQGYVFWNRKRAQQPGRRLAAGTDFKQDKVTLPSASRWQIPRTGLSRGLSWRFHRRLFLFPRS